MNQIVFTCRDAEPAPMAGGMNEDFAEFIESQAGRMERCGYGEEASSLRRWAKELRNGTVEAGYRIREPLLPRI